MIKKLFLFVVTPLIACATFVGLSFAVNNPSNTFTDPNDGGGTQGIGLTGTGTGQNDSFITIVKGGVNWLLGILALIALIIVLYGGFQMVTSAGDDEKYKSGFTILKHAATGLILIGISWFIISIIFWLVNILTTGATPDGSNT